MTTEERMELGAKYKREMNCCQAVLKAMSDTVDMDEATLHRLAGGFGSGMGTMEGTCGALVGAIMVASLRASGGSQSPATATGEAMKLSRQILPRFRELCGATICRELKGIGSTTPTRASSICAALRTSSSAASQSAARRGT